MQCRYLSSLDCHTGPANIATPTVPPPSLMSVMFPFSGVGHLTPQQSRRLRRLVNTRAIHKTVPPSSSISGSSSELISNIEPALIIHHCRTHTHTHTLLFYILGTFNPYLGPHDPTSGLLSFASHNSHQPTQPYQPSPLYQPPLHPTWPSRSTKNSSTPAARTAARPSTLARTTTAPAPRIAPRARTEEGNWNMHSAAQASASPRAQLGGLHATPPCPQHAGRAATQLMFSPVEPEHRCRGGDGPIDSYHSHRFPLGSSWGFDRLDTHKVWCLLPSHHELFPPETRARNTHTHTRQPSTTT
jgi:hypothetical protein